MNTSHSIRGHAQDKFEIDRTKIKGGCQSGRKVVSHNSKSDLPLVYLLHLDIFVVSDSLQLRFTNTFFNTHFLQNHAGRRVSNHCVLNYLCV